MEPKGVVTIRSRNADGTFTEEDYSNCIGKKYGKLTIQKIYRLENKINNRIRCICLCECGVKKDISLSNVINGKTRSCGCGMRTDIYNNLIGKKYGKLTVVERLPDTKSSQARYKCVCDCGNSIEVYGSNLLYDQTKSCGCIHKISAYNDTIWKTNKSGVKGVYYKQKDKRWVAKLTIKGKRYSKQFKTFDEAVDYRKYLEKTYHQEFKDEYMNLKKNMKREKENGK